MGAEGHPPILSKPTWGVLSSLPLSAPRCYQSVTPYPTLSSLSPPHTMVPLSLHCPCMGLLCDLTYSYDLKMVPLLLVSLDLSGLHPLSQRTHTVHCTPT
jgi:hypothetical protein